GAAGPGPVEHARVRELELAHRELVAVAAQAVLGADRLRQPGLPAPEEAPDLLRRQAGGDLGQRGGVGDRPEPVVKRLKREAAPLGLALCPLVAVQTQPYRPPRVRARPDAPRPPLPVADVEGIVVGEDRTAALS